MKYNSNDDSDTEDITLDHLEDEKQNSRGWWNSIKNNAVEAPPEFIYLSTEVPISGKDKCISLCENYCKILIAFYEVHAPHKLTSIKSLIESFKKSDIKLRQLIKLVERAYSVTLIPEQQKQRSQQQNNAYRINLVKESCSDINYNSKSKRCIRNNKSRINKGKRINSVSRLEKEHRSAHSAIDQESNLIEEHLLDKDYCDSLRKKRNNMIKKTKVSIINNNDNFYLDEMNLQKRSLSKNNNYSTDNETSTLTPSSSCESILTRERLEKFYRANNPKKLNNVDTLLEKFKGRDDRFFKRLEETYNVDDSPF